MPVRYAANTGSLSHRVSFCNNFEFLLLLLEVRRVKFWARHILQVSKKVIFKKSGGICYQEMFIPGRQPVDSCYGKRA